MHERGFRTLVFYVGCNITLYLYMEESHGSVYFMGDGGRVMQSRKSFIIIYTSTKITGNRTTEIGRHILIILASGTSVFISSPPWNLRYKTKLLTVGFYSSVIQGFYLVFFPPSSRPNDNLSLISTSPSKCLNVPCIPLYYPPFPSTSTFFPFPYPSRFSYGTSLFLLLLLFIFLLFHTD